VNFNFGELAGSLASKGARFFDAQGNPLSPEEVIATTEPSSIEGTANEIPDDGSE
jgi:hypothetical protein